MIQDLNFLPINFDLHSEICIRFRADSFISSFGTDRPFWEDDGQGDARYLEWLKSRDLKRYGVFHVWLEGEIIGQLELGERSGEDEFGYVHLYYLVPACRGKGYSKAVDTFATTFIKNLGHTKMRLSVSPTNLRAMQFYKKNGWSDLGPRDVLGLKFPLHLMEKVIPGEF